MKIELHVNGQLQIWLKPETTLESAVLASMEHGATKGKAVSLKPVYPAKTEGVNPDYFVVGVEK